MTHRRKTRLRKIEPNKLDAPVVMFSYLQSEDGWHNWKHRMVTLRTAQQEVADGNAIVITREHKGDILTMYREAKPLMPSQPTPCTLTMTTMHAAAANRPGAKLTLSECAHIEKLTLWPFDSKRSDGKPAIRCTTVRPAVTDRERKAAEAIVRRAQGVRANAREFKAKPRTQVAFYELKPVAA